MPAVKDIILDAVKAVLGVKGSGGRRSTASKYLIVSITKTQHRTAEEITMHRVLLAVAISMIFTLTPELKRKMY